MPLKEAFRGKRVFTGAYPLAGARTSGTGKFVVDLIKQAVFDTLDTLTIHLTGNVTVVGASAGTASGAYNPEGLLVQATLQTSPNISNLVQVNAIGSRSQVIDRAIQQRTFQRSTAIANTAGIQAVDVWYHFTFKRQDARKGIEYALPMNRWTSATLSLTLGTIDQLFTGSTNTWDMTGVNVEVWTDVDVDVFGSGGPQNIHASELFELIIPVTANNAALDINNLPQNCFYDTLVFRSEDAGALTDGIINNISIQSAGRQWVEQGDNNAEFVRMRYTRPIFYDPTEGTNLTGIYIFPLRDGLWSRAMDATSVPLDLKLNVTSLSGTSQVIISGRKLVPFGIRQTTVANGQKSVVEKTPILR